MANQFLLKFCILGYFNLAFAIQQSNILFLLFDDLRPELTIYGKSHMITPNFERLAKKSVVFDHAYVQVAVCNPSRISLLTGLRPDTTNFYGFQSGYRPYLIFPTRLMRSGYKTAGIGKIVHWDGFDKEVWHEHYSGPMQFYDYQDFESRSMNSTVMPDKSEPEHDYPDYLYASKAIDAMRRFKESKEFFMVSVGFKMPHTSLHVPWKYFDMYRSVSSTVWRLSDEERRYPRSASMHGYQCCAEQGYRYMQDEGASPAQRFETLKLQDLNYVMPQDMYTEMMWGYAAAVTFVDKQLGRILDALDELDLWKNTTIVLTSDHGIHNGEKGIWEKWSLFDESTRVPLLIHHPMSPMKGKRYTDPVELIDIFPTIVDLLGAPFSRKRVYSMPGARFEREFIPLQGKSLAPFILGNYTRPKKKANSRTSKDFALSQKLVCAHMDAVHWDARTNASLVDVRTWNPCDVRIAPNDEISVMGYSMRTVDFRYTAWLPVDRGTLVPMWSVAPFAEELYDHRGEELGELGHREIENMANESSYRRITKLHRKALLAYLQTNVVYSQNTRMVDAKDKPRVPGTSQGMLNSVSSPKGDKEKGALSLRAGQISGAGGRRSKRPLLRTPRNITHQTNLLFIIFDDLRPELSIYGKSHMITPNFERLSRRSVVFDQAHCQIAVCNPSRDSLLTGLYPDTAGTWNFFSTYDHNKYLILPTQLQRSGYRTFGYGKIRHWDGSDIKDQVWEDNCDLDWYVYQNYESDHMNSTIMPDKNTPEYKFPDHNFTTQAINTLRKMHSENKDYYMVGLGFKMPHTSLHIPWKYFDMYRSRSKFAWQLPADKRGFPPTAPVQHWRCCATHTFRYMREEGALPATREFDLEKIEIVTPQDMYTEMMWGYSAAISFVDYQLGRVLDVLDELDLWKNLTIVLTADHGMHNGEKGIWEKWSLFDESTRVPLMMYHPSSPIKGQRYSDPVDLVDVYPTLLDLLGAPYDEVKVYQPYGGDKARRKFKLQGRSLAPFILGQKPQAPREFAFSQVLKCAENRYASFDPRTVTSLKEEDRQYLHFYRIWFDCNVDNKTTTLEVPIMGYSMRTLEYRYNLWLLVDREKLMPVWTVPFIGEELYDHRGESLSDLGLLETENVAAVASYKTVLTRMRDRLVAYLRNEVVYVREVGLPDLSPPTASPTTKS